MVCDVFGGTWGLCCVVPNAVMALRLFANAQKPGGANPPRFSSGNL
jgi:ATP synthase protein I